MNTKHPRMKREEQTVAVMIQEYCRKYHADRRSGQGSQMLCPECEELLEYARKRLRHCPFQEGKTTCGNCQVHCYKPAMREKIRTIMRIIGPRMLFSHPILALFHLFDGRRKTPIRRPQKDA